MNIREQNKVLRWLLSFMYIHKKDYLIIAGCVLVDSIIQTVITGYFQILNTEFFEEYYVEINTTIIFGILVCVLVNKIKDKEGRIVPEKIRITMIMKFYDKLLSSKEFYKTNSIGKCLSMITVELDALQSFYGSGMITVCSYGLKFIFSLGCMLIFFPWMSIVYIIILGVYFFIWSFFEKKRIKLTQKMQQARMTMNEHIYNCIDAFLEIFIYQSLKWELKNVNKSIENYNDSLVGASMNSSVQKSIREFMMHLSLIFIFLIFMAFSKMPIYQTGSIASFMLYLFMNMQSFIQVIAGKMDMQTTLYQAKKIYDFFDIEEKKNSGVLELNNIEQIDIKDVTYEYSKSIQTIDHINIDIKKGQHIAFVGRSGSGKSTLLKIAAGLLKPTSGNVLINGKDENKYGEYSLRNKIGFLFQENYIFAMSIKDNIRFGNIEASDQDVINAAKKACIHDDISRLPKSYETVLNEKGNNLSGGQKQRIALARIFLRNPDIVFMDEATSALDYETEIGIVKSIEKEFKNRIVITVAHRLETIKEYDRILYIDEGKIMLDGNYQYLIENKLFHEFLRS